MKVKRTVETKTDQFEIGDQIKVKLPKEKYTATAIQRRKGGMLFLLDQYLDDPMPMNAEGGTEGGYEGSDLRAALQVGEKLLPKKLRKHMVPFENGDLLTILSIQEMFGRDENFDKCEGQIPWMKDRQHRIAFRKGENEWGWLRGVVSAASFAYVCYGGVASLAGASGSLGVRPAFVLDL